VISCLNLDWNPSEARLGLGKGGSDNQGDISDAGGGVTLVARYLFISLTLRHLKFRPQWILVGNHIGKALFRESLVRQYFVQKIKSATTNQGPFFSLT
jgi:hypothetical protein